MRLKEWPFQTRLETLEEAQEARHIIRDHRLCFHIGPVSVSAPLGPYNSLEKRSFFRDLDTGFFYFIQTRPSLDQLWLMELDPQGTISDRELFLDGDWVLEKLLGPKKLGLQMRTMVRKLIPRLPED